jgi:hypothetical protein
VVPRARVNFEQLEPQDPVKPTSTRSHAYGITTHHDVSSLTGLQMEIPNYVDFFFKPQLYFYPTQTKQTCKKKNPHQ